MKVYGPYTRKDGRKHVILYENGHRQTMSYPKYLYWKETGILISDIQEIHHKDLDYTNDVISNYEVTDRVSHKIHHLKAAEKVKCKWCEKEFELGGTKLSRRKSVGIKGKIGPFCSKECSGRYGAHVLYIVMRKKGSGVENLLGLRRKPSHF